MGEENATCERSALGRWRGAAMLLGGVIACGVLGALVASGGPAPAPWLGRQVVEAGETGAPHGAGAPAPLTGAWRLFDFDDGQHFRYELLSDQAGGKGRGTATIDITARGPDLVELRVAGELGGRQFAPTTATFGPRDGERLVGGRWATTELAAFVTGIVFAPYWPVFFTDRELRPGARWSARQGEVAFAVEVLGECAEAGVKGLQGRWAARSGSQPEVGADWCVSPHVPLVLSARSNLPGQHAVVEARLVAYRSGKSAMSATRADAPPPAPAPGPSFPPAASRDALEGLYVGRYPDGDLAVSYLFAPSGRVALGLRRMVDPDAIAGWKAQLVPMGVVIAKEGDVFDVTLGTYQLLGDRIRLRTRELTVDVRRQLRLLAELWKEKWDRDTIQEKEFRAVRGREQIEIDRAVLVRQRDQTGRKLTGEFAHELVFPMRRSARYSFTPAGAFAYEDMFLGMVAGGGEIRGRGNYEIRGHEILFFHADGKVERRLFGDLGRDEKGREWVVIGHAVFIQGRFSGPPTPR